VSLLVLPNRHPAQTLFNGILTELLPVLAFDLPQHGIFALVVFGRSGTGSIPVQNGRNNEKICVIQLLNKSVVQFEELIKVYSLRLTMLPV